MCNYSFMVKEKKPTRDSDDKKLDKAGKKQTKEDRLLDLGKLIGRKPPKK